MTSKEESAYFSSFFHLRCEPLALNVKNPEADRLAHELARVTGESITDVVIRALQERLARVLGRRSRRGLRDDVARIQDRIATLPRLDVRTDEELLGYDDNGLPQ